MPTTAEIAQLLIEKLKNGTPLEQAKNELEIKNERWFAISAKTYALYLADAEEQRDKDMLKQNVSATSNQEIQQVLALNKKLADYALLLYSLATMADVEYLSSLSEALPESEMKIIESLSKKSMHPGFRARQKKGRFETLLPFKPFVQIIDAALICFYRQNYISAYLTLAPVIEGVLLRWAGYSGTGNKPEFDDHRKFFKRSHIRQPCPSNVLFHNVFNKVCDKILNDHLFKPTQSGDSHSNFNRHLAAHLLNDNHFATWENCNRLFLLLDTMTEIYLYETREPDPRFDVHPDNIKTDVEMYAGLILDMQPTKVTERIKLESPLKTGEA
ncbi:hypothetical protein [Pedobacter sp. FW305-3-2-15-E-R2A2]|uniref:hypothetical protein n=1 Tax=Pedobacter sp. FW305-3-2-15-E-R2A2 TaxID=3140251 RepID=UPI0031407892